MYVSVQRFLYKTSIYEALFSGVSILCYHYSMQCGLLMDKNEQSNPSLWQMLIYILLEHY